MFWFQAFGPTQECPARECRTTSSLCQLNFCSVIKYFRHQIVDISYVYGLKNNNEANVHDFTTQLEKVNASNKDLYYLHCNSSKNVTIHASSSRLDSHRVSQRSLTTTACTVYVIREELQA